MTNLLTVVAEMKAKPGQEDALRQAALALVAPTRKEEGCVQYDLHEHKTEPGRFVFYENWASEEHLARHAASEHLKYFGAIRGDLLDGPPKVERYRRIA
jgi:quinol monooxygenase YgiN